MFGLTFDLVALVNAIVGGFVGAAVSIPIALHFYRQSSEQALHLNRQSSEQARRAADAAEQAFVMTARFLDSFADQTFRALGIRDRVRVTWSKDASGKITNANVVVSAGAVSDRMTATTGRLKGGDQVDDEAETGSE